MQVGFLTEVQIVRTTLRQRGEAPQLPSLLRRLASSASDETAQSIDRCQQLLTKADSTSALLDELETLVRTIRARNGKLSIKLGEKWDSLFGLVIIALFLVMASVVLLLIARNQTRALGVAKQDLEEENHAMSILLAKTSHEIRNPLGGIIGLSKIMIESDPEPQQRKNLEIIHSSGESLLNLTNGLLDLSQMEASALQLSPTPVDLRELALQVVTLVGVRSEKVLELRYQIDESLPRRVVVDGPRLRQVLINLLINAVKFTTEGHVNLEIKREAPPGAPPKLCVSVSDTGIGMSADEQLRIFHAFSQANRSIARRYGGVGLGLTIASELVQKMGGQIRVDSTPSVGSAFSFELPLIEG